MNTPPGMLTLDQLRSMVEAGEIDTVLVAITDMQGRLQGKRCTARFFLDEVARHGTEGCNYLMAVDVEMNTVDGFAMSSWERGYGDLLMRPDINTLRRIPWYPATALVLCDAVWLDGSPVLASPRQILRRQLERLDDLGYDAYAATELEFQLFNNSYEDASRRGYRDLEASSQYNIDYSMIGTGRVESLLRDVRNGMAGAGMCVETAKGECNLGQHEIGFRYDTALTTCDNHSLYKTGAKEIAAGHGKSISFMAKRGQPVLLPPTPTDPGVLDVCDGLLLIGGADVEPAFYGALPHPATDGTRPTRDRHERQLFEAAMTRGLPVLGVCRGAQLMAAALGGTLHQHLPELLGHDGHRPEPGVFGTTTVHILPGSLTAHVLGTEAKVPCYHHQGLGAIPSPLVATAWADDGLVEAWRSRAPTGCSACSGIPRRTPRTGGRSRRWSARPVSDRSDNDDVRRDQPGDREDRRVGRAGRCRADRRGDHPGGQRGRRMEGGHSSGPCPAAAPVRRGGRCRPRASGAA